MKKHGREILNGSRWKLVATPSVLTLALLCAACGAVSAGETPQAADAASAGGESAKGVPAVRFAPPPAGKGVAQDSSPLDLAARGYSEEEFLVSGTANRYRTVDPLETAQLVDGGHPYTTRILVRRPTDPAKFNGIVIIEWLNVTGMQDVDAIFGSAHEHMLDKGYAWVGVSAQIVGAKALKDMDSVRYASINLTADNIDPAPPTRSAAALEKAKATFAVDLPKDGELDSRGDVLGWDAFTQIAAGLKQPASLDPLGGLRPKLTIAAGFSQSASRLSQYYNLILPMYPGVFDGFLLGDRVRTLRSDLSTKVVSIGTESFYAHAELRLPPPDAPNLRVWELAGSSHNSYEEMVTYFDPLFKKMRLAGGLNRTGTAADNPGCAVAPRYSGVRNSGVLSAQLEALVTWITQGKAPPAAPRFGLDANGRLLRDSEGRIKGGVRIADYDVPIAQNFGTNSGPAFCGISGSHTNFTPAQLCERYGSSENYVAKVTEVTRRAESQGYLLKAGADKVIEEAKRVPFACSGSVK